MTELKGKNAVVTGAGGGIGRSIALALADAGANVVVADIRADLAEAVALQIRRRGVKSLAVHCDISKVDSVKRLCERSFDIFGSIQILCNNAGVTWRPYRLLDEASLEDFQHIYNTNLWGTLHSLMTFLPRMKSLLGEKHIVNTASLAGLIPVSGHSAYSSSKAAIIALSEALATEVKPFNVGVTILCPGVVPTDFQKNSTKLRAESAGEEMRQFTPLDPPELARFRAFSLSSADSIGEMVCDAIRRNALYLHTVPIPSDYLEERMNVQFGPTSAPHVEAGSGALEQSGN